MTKYPQQSLIAENKRARFEYHLSDFIESGLSLLGWEVKSLRAKRVQITESHIIIRKGEAWLIGAIITPLISVSSHVIPDQTRTRKLLLKKKELVKLIGQVERRGYTIVPIKLYWKNNIVKLTVALGKGKKLHDKRISIKERDWQRQQARLKKLKP